MQFSKHLVTKVFLFFCCALLLTAVLTLADLHHTFQYCPDNIQGPGCTIDPCELTLPGCSCVFRSCSAETCSCLQTHGQAYSGTGKLLDLGTIDSDYSSPVFECNALCGCSDACRNRVVQRGLRLRLEVFSAENKGWGVRTLECISGGTFVCEYAGEVIGFQEARRRQLSQKAADSNYIIAVREHSSCSSVAETFVDPAAVGNVGRFLNHSCQPNLVMQPVRVHSLVPRLALFAGRDINVGEELTFDYSGGYNNPPPGHERSSSGDAALLVSRTDGLQRKACHCGAKDCAKFLPLDLSVLS